MDTETRDMFGKVLSVLDVIKTDMNVLKTDMNVMNQRMGVMEQGMGVMNQRMGVMEQGMGVMNSRQDEMYIMLKGSEESRQRMKSLEEKSSIATLEIDHMKLETAKIVGAIRRGAQEIMNGLVKEDVS